MRSDEMITKLSVEEMGAVDGGTSMMGQIAAGMAGAVAAGLAMVPTLASAALGGFAVLTGLMAGAASLASH